MKSKIERAFTITLALNALLLVNFIFQLVDIHILFVLLMLAICLGTFLARAYFYRKT
ncbi:hypothetical protein ADIS_4264 [Lunatimonas lonarensis]|uniref:Uncharacterized protein n=1 Tax=Lunatimonas lonarensis TaxID=1232681 RepID=R7ZLX8_9BACT|nr:hypothetical protein [Lunatimonas lonarensis]EON75093.1 hypothetical protein ADIS_4264 [Lunatimonas lonarensis]